MRKNIKRSIFYGLGLSVGLVIVALAVLVLAVRQGTNDDDDEQATLGLVEAPRFAVLGEQAVPLGDSPVACNGIEFVPNAGGQNITPVPTTEPTVVPATRLLPPPCVHALAWVAAPLPADFPATGGHPEQGGSP